MAAEPDREHWEGAVQCKDCGWGDAIIREDRDDAEQGARKCGEVHTRETGHSVQIMPRKLTDDEYRNWLELQGGPKNPA